jgi:flagellar hook assembly protein FlgD
LDTGFIQSGKNAVIWDGRNDAGHAVGNGAYFVALQTATGRDTAKILLLK